MYAISFDLSVEELRKNYGDSYNNAYFEIRTELEKLGFVWTQGSLYINSDQKNSLVHVTVAMSKLASITWFKNSCRDICAFKVEDWSDFTAFVKGQE